MKKYTVILNQTTRKFNATIIQTVRKYEVKNTGIVYRIVDYSEELKAELANKADNDHDHDIGNQVLLFENNLV